MQGNNKTGQQSDNVQPEPLNDFAQNLRSLRSNAGLYQKEVAKELGITVAAYSLYETGKREPNFAMLSKIADYFNTTISELLDKREKFHTTEGGEKMNEPKGLKSIDTAMLTSSRFAFMPHSTQVLYLHLAAHSDGDGFVKEPKDICRAIGCTNQDMELLDKSDYILTSNVSNGIFVRGVKGII